MQIQKVFQAGNSQVVAIPKDLAREVGFSVGKRVVVEKTPDNAGIIIKHVINKNPRASKRTTKTDEEFQSWLNQFMEENGEILDELALR